ncbi:MAG TPA: peroxiredoxin-like family protein [Vineibacter sp.]|nr:peroxiredoxin-like family protein [Vineibacter sp.]
MNLKQTLEALHKSHSEHIGAPTRHVVDDQIDRLHMLRIPDDGLGVDDYLPDFELQGIDGNVWRSGALLDRGPLVLAFFRGGWCPYCELTMSALEGARPSIEAFGATAVGILPESIELIRRIAAVRDLHYPLLSDPRNAYAGLCGLAYELSEDFAEIHARAGRDLPAMHGDERWRLPVPAVFVVEPSARIAFAFSDASPSKWPDPEDLLASLKSLTKAD